MRLDAGDGKRAGAPGPYSPYALALSGDGGRTFAPARITRRPPDDSPSMTQSFGWTLWEAEVPVHGGAGGEAELCVKAVDSALNCQPESEFSQWTFRGIATNAWHRVRVKLE